MTEYVIVALSDNTVISLPKEQVLASEMTVLEERCTQDRLSEKVSYWDKIYNNKPDEEVKLHHFFNEKRNLHLWSIHNTLDKISGIRHKSEYKLMPE